MNLETVITAIEDWESKTAVQILDILSAKTVELVNKDSWSLLGIASIIGPQNVLPFLTFLESVGLGWIGNQAAGRGVPIGDWEINAALRNLNNEFATQIAEVGRKVISVLEQNNLQATIVEIQMAMNALQLEAVKRQKQLSVSQRYNDYVSAIEAWNGEPATEPVL